MLRLFIAIPVPEDIRDRIEELIADLEKTRGLPKDIRFVPRENWHFTLTFLGYQEEKIISTIKEVIGSGNFYRIEFEKLIYGPPSRGRSPLRQGGGLRVISRMIWITVTRETSAMLSKIKKELEDELETKGVKWRRETRLYRAHLTLARFRPKPAKSLPPVEREINWRYEGNEINLMKSTLKKTGAEYSRL